MPRWQKLSIALAAALLMVATIASEMSAPRAQDGKSAEEIFQDRISGPIVQSRCITCHVQGGVSGHTRLVLARASDANHETLNLQTFKALLDAVADEGGANYILNKIQGVSHGGGVQVPAGSADFASMEWFLSQLGGNTGSLTASLTPQTLFDTVTLAPDWKTLRRAALIFAGRIPTEAEYASVESGSESDLRAGIRGLMEGPEFHEFLIRGSNDRLLTERDVWTIDPNVEHFVDFTNEAYRRNQILQANGNRREFCDWMNKVQFGFRRAPLELIAYVVENDRPYTEILTADYIMANPWASEAYGATTYFRDPDDVHEFRPSKIVSYYRMGDGFESEYDTDVQATRVLDPGPLRAIYPHAGILNTNAFLNRYPTTATNRNRARARWTYYHFLGIDVEKSASRTTNPVALADTHNPTMHNPACTVCHTVMDPVAGAFQNYSDDGYYKHAYGGLDSLDDLYKEQQGEGLLIEATSWLQRETLTWQILLAAGVETLRVMHPNHFYDDAAEEGGFVYLDVLRVIDADGQVIVNREFENLPTPVAPWGDCGEARSSQDNGRKDHFLLWGGHLQCAFYIDIDVRNTAIYDVEVVAWSIGRDERYEGDSFFAEISVVANGYEDGDVWYRDMRTPGFAGAAAADSDNSVQWLAQRIVADERFAEATVKFWWPAIMGSEIAEFPEETADADFEGRLLAANAQDAEVIRLTGGFRDGFHGGAAYNLKDLLVEIILSKWFRADAVSDADPVRRAALRDAGARRLLTPEELARKTAALTGVQWRREFNGNRPSYSGRWANALTDEYRLLYGGIDSDGITKRARDMTTVMAGVAKRHAVQVGCAVVGRELYLLPEARRRLFAGFKRTERGEGAIKGQLVELHDKLFGVRLNPDSPDVEATYELFVDVMQRRRAMGDDWFSIWDCGFWEDIYFFEGILDDVIEEKENEDGYRYYGFNDDRSDDFIRSVDFSDPHHTAQAWSVVLTAMLMDYRYLYL